jgi:hypothetical protein
MGTARRARRASNQWESLVKEFERSGQSENQFCDERDLGLRSFRKWRYRSRSKTAKPARGRQRSAFAPVSVSESDIRTQSSVNIDLGSEVKINCISLSIESIAQLALAVRHGR